MIENHRDHVVWIIRFTCDTAWLKHGMRTHGHTVENCILEKQADELSRYTNSLPDNVSHLHTLWNVEPPLHVKGFQPENNMDESEKKFYTMRYDTIRVCSPRFNLLFIVLRTMHRYFEILFVYTHIHIWFIVSFIFFSFSYCVNMLERKNKNIISILYYK